jgi:hypothetical protein
MTETFLGLERRRTSSQQQQQQQPVLGQQRLRVVLDQQLRAVQLELTLWRTAATALRLMPLFGEAAVVLLQAAVARHAVTVLRSPMPLCAAGVVESVLDYCGGFLPKCVPKQSERNRSVCSSSSSSRRANHQ